MPRIFAAWRTLFTFVLVTIAWVFFRAQSVSDALYVLTHFYRMGNFHLRELDVYRLGLPRSDLLTSLTLAGVVFAVDWLLITENQAARNVWQVRPIRWALYYACAYCIVCFGVFEHLEFIYFRF